MILKDPMGKITVMTLQTPPAKQVLRAHGTVTGTAIMGTNVLKDLLATVRDFVGGRAGTYEKTIGGAEQAAVDDLCRSAEELGADTVVGLSLDIEVVGDTGSMLMVHAAGTAVSTQ